MFDDATKMRFENALASRTLKKLSDQMVAEGLNQVVIYDLFDSFREFLSDAKREADEEQVCCSLESIVGWCSPGARWFDHYLSNDEIYAHRSGLTEPEVREISDLIMKHTPGQIFCGIQREPSGEIMVKTVRWREGVFAAGMTFAARRQPGGWELVSQKREQLSD